MAAADRRRGYARTGTEGAGTRLRGRTSAVPFEHVWQAALRLAGGGISGWTVTDSDDNSGVIHAVSRSLRGAVHDIEIRVSLDADAQTRVEASAQARKPGTDFGAAARRLSSFLRRLDNELGRTHSPRPRTR